NSSKYGQKVRSEIFRLGLQNDVILTGNITYIELPNIYYHAKINIFASECENCPNILLEALGAGRPLIVSNRQPMPEFGGDAVTYFNPSSPEDLALKLVSIIDDSVLMQNLSARARERSRQFCWKQTARMTWEAINQR
ncbi:MAG TPA: glycosyltransferase, partial [Chitinophagaceae bacterium]|nr:glycosyltransferase [Chitinophagaceae bacterium]